MAVEARYYSTRDPHHTMFADKKDADAHDRLLEATEEVAAVIERAGADLDSDAAYTIAAAIVEHRAELMTALRKAPKPAASGQPAAESPGATEAPGPAPAAAASRKRGGRTRAA